MIKNLLHSLQRPLLASSVFMIIGSNLNNLVNYSYHLAMGRLLPPSSYGELASLLSLEFFLVIIPSSVSLAIVKLVAAQKNKSNINLIVTWFNKNSFLLSVIFTLIMLMFLPLINNFLHLTSLVGIVLISLASFFIIPTIVNRAILQGLLRFRGYIGSLISESLIKLLVGIMFVVLGFGVFGAIVGVAVSFIVGFLSSQFLIKDYVVKKIKQKVDYFPFIGYTFPVLLASLSTTSFFTLDVVSIKYFFSSQEAGWYAALQALSKVMLFSVGPINLVMFPLVAKKHSENSNTEKLLYYSFGLAILIIIPFILIYRLFPDVIIQGVFGSNYLPVANLLVWVAVFIGGVLLTTLLVNYFLAIGKTKIVTIPLLGVIIQIIGVWFFHNNLFSVILMFVILINLVFLTLLLYLILFKRYKLRLF